MISNKCVDQGSFFSQLFGLNQAPSLEREPIVILERRLDWAAIRLRFSKFYGKLGRWSVPLKHIVLLLLYKHLEGISDENVVRRLPRDLALQLALNLTLDQCEYKEKIYKTKRDGKVIRIKGYIDPSTLSSFRERIGDEGIQFLEEEFYKVFPEPKGKGAKRFAVDTTAVPADIPYPTDINLLEEARRWLLHLMSKYSVKGLRTYKRIARKVYLTYIRLRRSNRIKSKAVHRKMRNFVRRNLQQALAGLKHTKLTDREKNTLATIQEMLKQQDELASKMPRSGNKSGIHIANRIVSVHQGHVRAIPRGKIGKAIEFGSKVLLVFTNGILRPLFITNENMADSKMLTPFMKLFAKAILGGDRGFHSKENADAAKEAGVTEYHIEKKGKVALEKTKSVIKSRSLRMGLEAKIGVAKNAYGLRMIRYRRGPTSDAQWIRLCLMAMNLKSLRVRAVK